MSQPFPPRAATFSWLHLTDLHMGVDGHSTLWPTMEHAFLEDLARLQAVTGPWNVVFFTGDLTQSGKPAEFRALEVALARLWSRMKEVGSAPLLVSVPGNHDAANRTAPLHSAQAIRDSASFWAAPQKSTKWDAIRREFTSYEYWLSHTKLPRPSTTTQGLLPGDFCTSLEMNGLRVGVLGLNTAAVQNGHGKQDGRLLIDTKQFHHPAREARYDNGIDWAKAHDFCFLMSHHPPEWLENQARLALNGEIAAPGRFVAHLFGHRHQAEATTISIGGHPPWRRLQGCSLFGLDRFRGAREARRHGYSAGRIDIYADRAELRVFPRRAERADTGVWSITPDGRAFDLREDGGSSPEIVPRGAVARRPTPASAEHDGTAGGSSLDVHAPEDATIDIPCVPLERRRPQRPSPGSLDLSRDATRAAVHGGHVLVVEDDRGRREVVMARMASQGYAVHGVELASQAEAAVAAGLLGVILLDLSLPDNDGLDLFHRLRAIEPRSRIIVMTAHNELEVVIGATRDGAFDFITKGSDLLELAQSRVARAFAAMAQEDLEPSPSPARPDRFGRLLSCSATMGALRKSIDKLCGSKASVLIMGQPGTGKDLVANIIHEIGPRSARPFVAVACSGVPDLHLEAELFGAEPAAAPEGARHQAGAISAAEGGTLFIDEIDAMSLSVQAKLLRMLRDGRLRPDGARRIPRDVRLLSATRQDLDAAVRRGEFREDLYYRASVITLHVPPLSERQEDIPLLVDRFVRAAAREEGKDIQGVAREVMRVLCAHPWPGNISQLQNVIAKCVLACDQREVSLRDLPREFLNDFVPGF